MSFFATRMARCTPRVALAAIAAQVGTPFYCYSAGAPRSAWREFADAIRGRTRRLLRHEGQFESGGHPACSANWGRGRHRFGGRDARALAAGIPARRIVYSGVGKKAVGMMAAFRRVGQINVESSAGYSRRERGGGQPRRRRRHHHPVNPDIDAGTHAKITTGRKENKFGIDIDLAREAYAGPAGCPTSGGRRRHAYRLAAHLARSLPRRHRPGAQLIGQLRADGHAIDRFDIGGGLGIVYADSRPARGRRLSSQWWHARPTGWAASFHLRARPPPGRRGGRPGERGHPGQARAAKTFVIVDAAMNDLIRPTCMYEAWHDILPVQERRDAATIHCDVVGPICESGDYLAQNRDLPPLAAGDLVMIRSAGAYGAVMARPQTPARWRRRSWSMARDLR